MASPSNSFLGTSKVLNLHIHLFLTTLLFLKNDIQRILKTTPKRLNKIFYLVGKLCVLC